MAGPLRNRKHEIFAQGIATGLKVELAYERSGFKADRRNAMALERQKKIKDRVEELRGRGAALQERIEKQGLERAINKVALSKGWVLDQLLEIHERCMQHKTVTDPFGNAIMIEGPDGSVLALVTFRPKEATRALELLGKEMGMFVERKDHTFRTEERLSAMPLAERGADARELVERVRQTLLEHRQTLLEGSVTDAEAIEVEDDGVEGGAPQPSGGIGK